MTATNGGVGGGRQLPQRFGRYLVQKRLGDGGMGSVYLVFNTDLQREEALKVPNFDAGAEAVLRERFLREARAAAGLDHPNLCPVYDVGECDGLCYLTMRYLKGKLLSEFTGAPQPPRKAVEIVAKLAQALAVAHAKGIIHRDLKPGNVMMCPGVGPVVMDFGLAKQNQQQGRQLTRLGSILGTPAYMPPEQVKGDLTKLGPASDVYSLGVILFELLTGRPPFEAATDEEMFRQILCTAAPAASALRPGLSPALDAVCRKALAKAPEQRPASMKALAAELIAYLKATPPPTEDAGNLKATRAGPADIFQTPTVVSSRAAPPPRQGENVAAPTMMGIPAPSSIRRPGARPNNPNATMYVDGNEQQDGRSSGALRAWALCGLMVLAGLGCIGVLVYLVAQRRTPSPSNVAVAPAPANLAGNEKPAESDPAATQPEDHPSPVVNPPDSVPPAVAPADPIPPADKPDPVPPVVKTPDPMPPSAKMPEPPPSDPMPPVVKAPDPDPPAPSAPDPELVAALKDPFAGRAPGALHDKLVRSEGGTNESEAAVARGLLWLALHQAPDGHWSLHEFQKFAHTEPRPDATSYTDVCTGQAKRQDDIAGTGFGLLPFLGDGCTFKPNTDPKQVDYSKTVKAGVNYLVRKQGKDGFLGGSMYSHAIGALALCEAYGMTSDPALKTPAQRAVYYIVTAQDPAGGGWRYSPKTPGDTSVSGWQLMALASAQMAGLTVPKETLAKAESFLDAVENRKGGRYGYMPGTGETPVMTAVGMVCRQHLNADFARPDLVQGADFLKDYAPGKTNNIYYEYYAAQAMHHLGGDAWDRWNKGSAGDGKGGVRDLLVAGQVNLAEASHLARENGSWSPDGVALNDGGRIMYTSLSLLTLEVYYRYPPLYWRTIGDGKKKD